MLNTSLLRANFEKELKDEKDKNGRINPYDSSAGAGEGNGRRIRRLEQ